jgi:diamine N-acetyltransferase
MIVPIRMNNEINMFNPILSSSDIFLRTPDLSDAENLFEWENDLNFKEFSSHKQQYSRREIDLFIRNNENIKANLQYRLMICKKEQKNAIGTIDLYEIDFAKGSAGVGILIADEHDRKKGFALSALELLQQFAKESLGLDHLFCEINKENEPSISLFKKAGFGQKNNMKIDNENESLDKDVYFYEKNL